MLGIKLHLFSRFHPPVIPADFEPHHKFSMPVQPVDKLSELAPPEVPPPEDNNLRLLIEGSAAMVARCGRFIEDLYKEKSKTNPLFLFLDGGDGSGYYARKLWEHRQKYVNQQSQETVKPKSSVEKMTAENRGKILGERPLARSSKESNSSGAVQEGIQPQPSLGDTFTKPLSLDDIKDSEKPFKNDPAKQTRFEQFLKEKFQGGLRSANYLPNNLSETDRARERLAFEAAFEAIERGRRSTRTENLSLIGFAGMNEQRFVPSSQIEETNEVPPDEKSIYPKREQFEWRPAPILCKRFEIVDPFIGKVKWSSPLDGELPRLLEKENRNGNLLVFLTLSSS